MKIVVKLLVLLIISIWLASIIYYRPNSSTMNTLYTVSGILFSIGLGLTITFVPNGVKNPTYIKKIRENINHVQNGFFWEFGIATSVYILFSIWENKNISLSFSIKDTIFLDGVIFSTSLFPGIQILSSIPYLIVNFLSLQKLNNEIFDRVNSNK